MVGNETPEGTGAALARRQAAGLRALADLIERHPELSARLDFALRHIGQPLTAHHGDARAVLEAFHAAAEASPAAVTVTNNPDRCRVTAHFHTAVAVSMWADADVMAGRTQPPHYTPLGSTPGGEPS